MLRARRTPSQAASDTATRKVPVDISTKVSGVKLFPSKKTVSRSGAAGPRQHPPRAPGQQLGDAPWGWDIILESWVVCAKGGGRVGQRPPYVPHRTESGPGRPSIGPRYNVCSRMRAAGAARYALQRRVADHLVCKLVCLRLVRLGRGRDPARGWITVDANAVNRHQVGLRGCSWTMHQQPSPAKRSSHESSCRRVWGQNAQLVPRDRNLTPHCALWLRDSRSGRPRDFAAGLGISRTPPRVQTLSSM